MAYATRHTGKRIKATGQTIRGGKLIDAELESCSIGQLGFFKRVKNRMTVEDCEFRRCHLIGCGLGPVIIRDTIIEQLSTDNDVLFVSGCFFERTKVLGAMPAMKIYNAPLFHNFENSLSAEIEGDNNIRFASIDWALDLTEARFEELTMVGVPREKVRCQDNVLWLSQADSDWRKIKLALPKMWSVWLELLPKDEPGQPIAFVPCVAKDQSAAFMEDVSLLRAAHILG